MQQSQTNRHEIKERVSSKSTIGSDEQKMKQENRARTLHVYFDLNGMEKRKTSLARRMLLTYENVRSHGT